MLVKTRSPREARPPTNIQDPTSNIQVAVARVLHGIAPHFSKLTCREPQLSSTAGSSDHYAQAEAPDERIEIPVVVQQVMPALDASGGNHRMDGLANRRAEPAQRAEVLRRLNRDFLSAQLHYHQRGQHFPGGIEVSLAIEALQDLSQN